jgi:hypothetical protein
MDQTTIGLMNHASLGSKDKGSPLLVATSN